MQNKKAIVLTVVAVVVAVVGFAIYRGYIPPKSGTEGAIGAANRYQSEQISAQDVTLDNPQVASFIQSDTFRKLATDKSFREAVRIESFRKVVGDNDFRILSAKVNVGEVLGSAAVSELLTSAVFKSAIESGWLGEAMHIAPDLFTATEGQRVAEVLKIPGFAELSERAEFRSFAQDYVKTIDAARTGEARSAVTEQLLMKEFIRLAELHGLAKSEAIRGAEANRYFPGALAEGFMELFARSEVAQFSAEGLTQLLDQRSFIDALRIEGAANVLDWLTASRIDAVRDIAASREVLNVLSSDGYRQVAPSTEFGMMAVAGLLDAAVHQIPVE